MLKENSFKLEWFDEGTVESPFDEGTGESTGTWKDAKDAT
jgi:hypothetical protein